jgi:site-specific DNA-methyltransferase (adenine-specific)
MKHDILPESIDLIYLDPPFFTGKVQKGTSKWQPETMEISYEDSKKFWGEESKQKSMRDKAPEWLKHIALTRPDFASYLFYMMIRLKACKNVLRPMGGIYLHCDYRASHYLKMIMDEPELFGVKNFRNEIVWHYTSGGAGKNSFAKKHDIIFFYSKSDKYHFEQQKYKRFLDKSKGYDPRIEYFKDKESGKNYRINVMPDVWTDIGIISPNGFERVGYPTQKPVALLDRIITASSKEGDTILDPFCGCGTAIISAHKLNRRWIGIDINKSAYQVTKGREVQMPLGIKKEFTKANYVSRDFKEVMKLNPNDFEKWVNEYYKATKPMPDKGVDGITQDGTPIQTKTFLIKYPTLSEYITNAKLHPAVPKPIKKLIVVSQVGFHESATKRQFEIQTLEGITVDLKTPEDMLNIDNF